MRPIACSQLQNLSNEYSNPSRAFWLMKDFMKTAIKLTKETVTKDMIVKFSNARIGFNEDEDIANRMIMKMKSTKTGNEKPEIIKNLMKHHMKDAIKCVQETKSKLEKSKSNLNQVVRKGTLVRDIFMEAVDNELGAIWKDGKNKNEQKLSFTIQKRSKCNNEEKETEETFKGVIIGDKELEKLESENEKKNETNNKPRVYSNIELTEDQKNILLLPPNHQTFPKLSLEKFETELEKCNIKMTWESMRKSRMEEKNHVDKENDDNIDAKKHGETEKVYEHKTKTLDLRNLKATDLKNNKRVIVTMNNDDEKEIKRNNVMLEMKKVFSAYKAKHCDKFGNLIEGNLDKNQRKTIKDLKTKINDEELVCFKTDKTRCKRCQSN